MNEEQWEAAWRLYRAAGSMSDEQIRVFLDSSAASPEVRDAVLHMRRGGEATETHTDAGSSGSSDGTAGALAPSVAAGTAIGRYLLVEKIGEGGMGEVWLADQQEPVRRRVALKVIKAGMNSREVIARFESERQALALMDHSIIAKVLDAGSTLGGSPYFVMEYVAGIAITTYCDEHRLSTRERLELFMLVCEGIQHAHQKAIIHRDLKPSNILVMEVDGRPVPKIIDFGVAKALTQKLMSDTMFTRVGALVGTPQYMSPEQALSSGEDIDTRTDVYSLGIVLYELLAGAPPLEVAKTPFDEYLRRLREDDPPKPSTKVRIQPSATSTEVARQRNTEPLLLMKQLRGDLDSITLKALQKDRSCRYGSPSDFGADIRRYLRNEPVLAVPPSTAYRARKFARRYRGALATACAFVLVLVAAAAFSMRQGIRANRETAVAQAVNDFLENDVLAQASAANQPGSKPDPELKVRTALDRAAARIAGKFKYQPQIEASIRETIGQTYIDLGLYPQARRQLEVALALDARTMGENSPRTLKVLGSLGNTAWLQGEYPEAEALFTRAAKAQSKVLGPENPETVESMQQLGTVYYLQGKYAQAEEQYKTVLEIRQRLLGPEDRQTMRCKGNLAMSYHAQGKFALSESLNKECLEFSRRILGPEHPDTLKIMNNLANDYHGAGKYAQGEALGSEVVEIRRRLLGPEHPDTLMSINNLGTQYESEGKFGRAGELYKEAWDAQRRILGPDHPDTLMSLTNLAGVYREQGEYARAEARYSEGVNVTRRVLGPEHPDTLGYASNLGHVYDDEGKQAQAEALLRDTLEKQRRVLGAGHPDTIQTLQYLASMYQQQAKYAEAELYASQALTAKRKAVGAQNAETMDIAADLLLAYISQGKFAEAEPLAHEAVQFERKEQSDSWQRFRAESEMGAVLSEQAKYMEAESLLVEGYRGLNARVDRIPVDERFYVRYAREWANMSRYSNSRGMSSAMKSSNPARK
jgi:tetratricopeptide (TPR) repeat protein